MLLIQSLISVIVWTTSARYNLIFYFSLLYTYTYIYPSLILFILYFLTVKGAGCGETPYVRLVTQMFGEVRGEIGENEGGGFVLLLQKRLLFSTLVLS